MTKSDEMTLKKWLFVQWQKKHNPKFFLAGAVIGKVADIYALAADHKISADVVQNFLHKLELVTDIDYDAKLEIVTAINCNVNWLIHILNNWADDPANNVPLDIRNLLNRNHDRGNSFSTFVDGQAFRFSDDYLRIPTDEEKDLLWAKNLAKALNRLKAERQKDLVSKTASARKVEDMLRLLHSNLFIMPRNSSLADEIENYVKNESENFFAEKIKRAKTHMEIISLWLEMTELMSSLDEIMSYLDIKLNDNYSPFDDAFLQFVEKWREWREKELVPIELKAQFRDLNLQEIIAESA